MSDRARRKRGRTPRDRRPAAALAIAALVFGHPATAFADGSSKIVADQLFAEGRALLERGEVAAACEKLSESQAIDPAGGTALLLGICYETEARLASAWSMLRSARAIAVLQGRLDRVTVADEHLRQIEPQLAYITVRVDAAADLPGLHVLLDQTPLNRASWNLAIPADGGPHLVRATAPGYATFAVRVNVPKDAGTTDVQVGPLVPEAQPAPSPVVTSASSRSTRSIAAPLTAGIAAVVALGAMGYFGVDAIVTEGQKPASCAASDTACANQWRSLENRRSTDATAATISGGVALAAAAAAIVLLVLPSHPRGPARSGWTLAPSLGAFGAGGGGMAIRF